VDYRIWKKFKVLIENNKAITQFILNVIEKQINLIDDYANWYVLTPTPDRTLQKKLLATELQITKEVQEILASFLGISSRHAVSRPVKIFYDGTQI
jgi:hypothetical protein